jgi:hypothetical protein
MNRVRGGFLAALGLWAGVVWAAADGQPGRWVIDATTASFAAVGLPAVHGAPGQAMKGDDGNVVPPELEDFLRRNVRRTLDLRLWTPGLAPAEAKAWVTPPAGLGQGPRLDLALYRPKLGDEPPATWQPGYPEVTVKLYWGSAKTVRAGQPKIFKMKDLSPAQLARFGMRVHQGGGPDTTEYCCQPGWTTAHWTTPRPLGGTGVPASLGGTFALDTTYAGATKIDVPAGLDFPPPITLTSPDLAARPDLAAGIRLAWTPSPNLLGYNAIAIGGQDESPVGTPDNGPQETVIVWTAAEEPELDTSDHFLSAEDVSARVANQRFLPGNAAACDIPAGIFAHADFAIVSLTGFGRGATLNGGPLPAQIQTRTSLRLFLPTKAMLEGDPDEAPPAK